MPPPPPPPRHLRKATHASCKPRAPSKGALVVTPPSQKRRPLGELDGNSALPRAVATPHKPSRGVPYAICEPVLSPALDACMKAKPPSRRRPFPSLVLAGAVFAALAILAGQLSVAPAPTTLMLAAPPPNYVLVDPAALASQRAVDAEIAPPPPPPLPPIAPAEKYIVLPSEAAEYAHMIPPRDPTLQLRSEVTFVFVYVGADDSRPPPPAPKAWLRRSRVLLDALVRSFAPPPDAACVTPYGCG